MRQKFIKIGLGMVLSVPLIFPIITMATAPGESFTVTASCGNIEGSVNAVAENATITSASNWCDRGTTLTATATAGSVGTASVSFVTVDATDIVAMTDASGVNLGGGSVTVSNPVVEQPTTPPANEPSTPQTQTPTTTTPKTEEPTVKKSNNANLSALTISTGTLSPEFDPATTDYSVSLAKDITSISINASVADAKATVSGTGEIALKAGTNEIAISVTAEDGTVKKYIIKAMVDETPDVFVQLNNKKLGVVKVVDDVQPPTSFEETTISLEGKNIKAYKSNLLNLTIVYMIDEANEKNWYLYDETSKTITSIYKPMALLGRNVAVIDVPQELQTRAGMKYGEVEVNKQKLMGWTFEDAAFENYVLIYLMDDKGKMQYYLYEKSENTLQLYSNQAALTQDGFEQMKKENEDALSQRMIMIIALAITNVLTILLLVFVAFKKKKRSKKVRIEPQASSKSVEEPLQNDKEEEIVPFDAWKYEEVSESSTKEETSSTMHLEPIIDEDMSQKIEEEE